MTKQVLSSELLSALAIEGLQEIKGVDVVKMDMRNVESAVTDFFVIATGTSDRHVQALADSVLKIMKDAGELPITREGLQAGEWALLDYGSVVIHIFQEGKRTFYRLEDLWGDAEFERIQDSGPRVS